MPEVARVVVVNTTPLICLAHLEKLDLLGALYRRVLIPPAVRDEIQSGGRDGVGAEALAVCDWIVTTPLREPRRADLLSDLDRGEAEVIALAQEVGADLVVIDERLARRHARRLGLTLTGTLGILLRAKTNHLIPAVKPLVEQLLARGIYLGAGVAREVLRLAAED